MHWLVKRNLIANLLFMKCPGYRRRLCFLDFFQPISFSLRCLRVIFLGSTGSVCSVKSGKNLPGVLSRSLGFAGSLGFGERGSLGRGGLVKHPRGMLLARKRFWPDWRKRVPWCTALSMLTVKRAGDASIRLPMRFAISLSEERITWLRPMGRIPLSRTTCRAFERIQVKSSLGDVSGDTRLGSCCRSLARIEFSLISKGGFGRDTLISLIVACRKDRHPSSS